MKAFWGRATEMVVGMTVAALPLFAHSALAQGRDVELTDSGDSDQGVQDYQEAGFYFGVGLGIAKSNQDVEDFNDNFLNVLAQNNFDLIDGTAELEESDTAFALRAGYNFNEYLGAEVSYINFGTVEYRARAQVQLRGPNPLLNASSSAEIETQGVALAGVGRLPVSDAFAVRTRLGLIFAKSDVDVTVDLPGGIEGLVRTSNSDSTNEANLFFSVGATYSFENRWTLSLDYEILKRTGDDDFVDDIGVVSLGLAFRL